MILPFASERRKAARLDVYAAVSVGLILMRRAGLHLGEALIGRNGVDLDPALPVLLLTSGRLKRGQAEWGEKGENVNKRKENNDILKPQSSSGFDDPGGSEANTVIQHLKHSGSSSTIAEAIFMEFPVLLSFFFCISDHPVCTSQQRGQTRPSVAVFLGKHNQTIRTSLQLSR